MSKTEAQILADVVSSTRDLAWFYLSKLNNHDLYHNFIANGKTFNSAYWLLAHMAWSENFLLLQAARGPALQTEWLDLFRIGQTPPKENLPSFEEVLGAFKQVHETALKHISQLSDEELASPNAIGLSFGNDTSVRSLIHHHIRHEGTHIGHLGWLAKMYGVKTV